ncbi:zinc finger BED domain-containing protein 4 [Hydra vulgaris]|uniref:zinc finger BED domain-containing protein 4 n=1 Tax=Hydra vulgaris TaxID=6087 RepID=UPI001F5EF5B5|nr:zinc finger BED domain-containing protein 4 [Hydra vulgaris]
MDEYSKSQKVWSINDSRSQTINRKIGLMMALDSQPFTLVEDTGFNNLMNHLEPRYCMPSRKFFSKTIIPQLYMELNNKISDKLIKTDYISFSSDIWTCPISHESFISFSSHSIDKDFNRFDVVLHASHFSESHTGINISKKLESMWDSWKIEAERRHILVRDGASNMISGSNLAEIPAIHCTIHLLQLVVSDSISENIVIDVLSKCRRLVTHFNHSSLACNNFKQIQLQQNLDPLCLVQDVPTRWNSTYLMLDRLNKLKIPVQLYLAERSDLMPFSTLEWTLILNIIKLLKPFFQLTQEMSSEITTLSSVIPNMCSLKKFMSKCQVDLSIQETKNRLTTSLKNRFFSEINDAKSLNILKNRYYVIATSIDPRYKFSFFEDDIKKQAKYWLINEILSFEKTLVCSEEVDFSVNEEPSQLNFSINTEKEDTLEACFKEIINATSEKTLPFKKLKLEKKSNEILIGKEIKKFYSEPLVDRKLCPIKTWMQEERFPLLKTIASKHLCTPASFIFSERLFSEYGNIYEKKRSRLLPKTAEMLLFIHHNGRKIE